MIEVKDKSDCCGCHACATACAKHCITMQTDEEGFFYPVVDKDACTNCGLCEKVCPVLNQSEPRKPLKVFAAKNPNEEIRRQSSSGGIFTLLAEKVIAEGGVVFGARFDEEWNVIHSWTDTIEGIAAFRGSKYVQSRIGDTYREAREFLKQGRKVLFSGTPCQIAGLKKYLRKEYDNLLTVDFICHGVPSPGVWQRFLNEFRENIKSESVGDSPVITGVSFRDKRNGWKKYIFCLHYVSSTITEEQEFILPVTENAFLQGFLRNVYLRPSCHACSVKSGKSDSDITIADAWGLNQFAPEYDDDKGTCYILENTEVGSRSMLQLQFDSYPVNLDKVYRYNSAYVNSSKPNSKRRQFFKLYSKGTTTIEFAVQKVLTPNCINKLKQGVKTSLAPIKRILFK